ncbi:MAG TPA: B12-binding domain-containing radical SAM protein [Desulfobaccales bacterium]
MRTLLINPESPFTFWTLKDSYELLGRKTLTPPLGLLTVAALLPPEWELRLIDLNTGGLTDADWDWADLVLLTGMIIQRHNLLALIKEAKYRGKTVVVGGPYATSLPGEVLAAGADFLVQGEGENTIPLLLAALREGKPRGTFEAAEKPAMTASPAPRFDLLKLDDYVILTLQTSRGCPFECEFCDIINLYGRKPRYKSPGQVISELETLYRLGWREEVFIADDNFIGNKEHAREILRAMIPWLKDRGEPISFWAQTSVNLGQDLEMIDLMTAANFGHVFLGVESPDPEVLALNRKYQNLKNPLEQSLANITANGLTPVASFVIGFDGETAGAGERLCAFVEQNHLPMVMLNTLQVLPNTALWDRLQREGRLLDTETSCNSTMGRLNYRPSRPESEIIAEYREAVHRLYEPSGYLRRAVHHILSMRPTRRALGLLPAESAPGQISKTSAHHNDLRQITAFLKLVWRQGIMAEYRLQFWRQLIAIYRRNPSRMVRYLDACGMGENLFRLRKEILKADF